MTERKLRESIDCCKIGLKKGYLRDHDRMRRGVKVALCLLAKSSGVRGDKYSGDKSLISLRKKVG